MLANIFNHVLNTMKASNPPIKPQTPEDKGVSPVRATSDCQELVLPKVTAISRPPNWGMIGDDPEAQKAYERKIFDL